MVMCIDSTTYTFFLVVNFTKFYYLFFINYKDRYFTCSIKLIKKVLEIILNVINTRICDVLI